MNSPNPVSEDPKAALKRFPLVQEYSSRNGTILKDARLVNAYAEKQIDGGWQVRKRPGLQGYDFTVAIGGLGIASPSTFHTGLTALAFYNSGAVYFVGPGTTGAIAGFTVDGSARYTSITIGTSTATSILYQNGTHAYFHNIATAQTVMNGVGGFPTNPLVPGWAYLDGTTYVMDQFGNIYGSNINDFTTWNGLNVIQANASPDFAVGLQSYLTYVVAFKQYTTNVFYDAGNPTGSPLSPVVGAQIPYGCIDGHTIQQIDGIMIWVAVGSGGLLQVGSVNNLQFAVISTPQVDRLLAEAATLASNNAVVWSSWVCKTGGHRFYGVSATVTNTSTFAVVLQFTIVVDLDEKLWLVWTDSTGLNPFPAFSMATYPDYAGNPAGYITVAQDPSNGMIYRVLPDYDANVDATGVGGGVFINALIQADIYTPSFDGKTRRRKMLNTMFFNADKDPGSILQCRYNDSDYGTDKWSNFREVDLNKQTPQLDNWGTFRRRAMNFRHRCATPLRIGSVDLQIDLGTL